MEEKDRAFNLKMDPKCFQACFYYTETYKSYHKKLLLELLSFSSLL